MEKENENKIENEIEDDSQDKILESLTAKDYYNIKLPKDDFFDFQSVSSLSDNEDSKDAKKRYRFGQNMYEKFSAYYLCETVLENPKNIKFIDEVDINKLTVFDRSLSWFDDNLFDILLKFCKQDTKNIIFHPDYIINNIEGKNLIEKIKKYKENIHCFKDWIKNDKKYDLIGEISVDYLTTSKERKLSQTQKYINFIRLFEEIEKCQNIKTKIKKEFEEKLGLINENEKILVLTSDGNYEDYLNNLKQSKIFKTKKNNETDDPGLTIPQKILKVLKISGVHFIIIYVPRAYVNIQPAYSENETIKIMKEKIDYLTDVIKKLTLRLEKVESKEENK